MMTTESLELGPLTADGSVSTAQKKGWSDLSYQQRFKFAVVSLAGIPASAPTRRKRLESEDAVDGIKPDFDPNDYSSHITFCPPPIFILLVSISQIVLFCIPESSKVSRDNPLVYNPCRRYEVWRYITYIYVHNSVSHLVMNVLIQIMIGSLLELVHTIWRVPVVYFSGALAGCLLQSMVGGNKYVVGASGAVFALLGARIANIILNWKEMGVMRDSTMSLTWHESLKKIMSSAPLQIFYCSALVVALVSSDIYSAVTSSPNVSYAYGAHYGGLGAGLLLGLLVLVNVIQAKWETRVQVTAAILLGIFFIIALFYNIFSPTFLSQNSVECLYVY